MNREKLQNLASEWVRIAKNDIRGKVIDFMEEMNIGKRELAYKLAISNGELEQILEGNGEVTLSTFAKLLIASGNALEIKPIEMTPMGGYEPPIPPQEDHYGNPLEPQVPRYDESPTVIDSPYDDEVPPPFPYRHIPINDDIDDDEYEYNNYGNRFANGEQRRWTHQEVTNEERVNRMAHVQEGSPFSRMSTERLVEIINEHLWDSEIDLEDASREELIEFLDEKDKRMKEIKQIRELENDPKVKEFKERLKKTIEENPHLKEWTKKFMGELN